MMNQDRIYAYPQEVEPFEFNRQVVEVFDDMIERSVPHYREMVAEIIELAVEAYQPDTWIYDLGCSLGAVLLPVANRLQGELRGIVGVDQAEAMLQELAVRCDGLPVDLVCDDMTQVDISEASVVILHLTLQFIPVDARDDLIRKIYDGMVDGGILIVSEKILSGHDDLDEIYRDRHHAFKRAQGYSDLEIHQKRQALEDVLVAETKGAHLQRFQDCGFSTCDIWHQHYNFASFLARR